MIYAQTFLIWEFLRIVLVLSHLSDSFFSGKSLLESQIAEERDIRRKVGVSDEGKEKKKKK